jgi:hypothetical protein
MGVKVSDEEKMMCGEGLGVLVGFGGMMLFLVLSWALWEVSEWLEWKRHSHLRKGLGK